VVGHVLAGLELETQVAVPPDVIVVPLGTGGTAAGVALAVAALGWPTEVLGVRVAPALVANRWRTAALAHGARRLLVRRGIALPAPRMPALADGLGRGYGWPTAAGEEARRRAAEHGLVVDPAYGAKALAVVPALAARGFRRIVFWHTFGVPLPELEAAR
jgi:1-aminocyclopropane-1-carboxylate deaminase/D-cysteine desulfhydrase-like pyridoxal-dependent ACC family enzyme